MLEVGGKHGRQLVLRPIARGYDEEAASVLEDGRGVGDVGQLVRFGGLTQTEIL